MPLVQMPAQHAKYLRTQRALPLVSVIAIAFAVTLAKWAQNARSRQALSRLDQHHLRDIGLTPDQARTEVERKFWQG